MAKYGAEYLKWAPFATTGADESATAYPKYGTVIALGGLTMVSDSPTFSEASLYGDNVEKEYVCEFTSASVDAGVTELDVQSAATILGADYDEDDGLQQGEGDTAPYGGVGFYIRKVVDGVTKYQGIYYPKVKAQSQGEEYTTKGNSITLVGDKLKFKVTAPANGKWKVKSENLATSALAKAWVDGLVADASDDDA